MENSVKNVNKSEAPGTLRPQQGNKGCVDVRGRFVMLTGTTIDELMQMVQRAERNAATQERMREELYRAVSVYSSMQPLATQSPVRPAVLVGVA